MKLNGFSAWLTRLLVLLRRTLRTPAFYVTALMCISVQFVIGTAVLPASTNTAVGLISSGESYAALTADALQNSDSPYRYILYQDAGALRNDVAAGKLDCGFVLGQKLDDAVLTNEWTKVGTSEMSVPVLDHTIDFISSTSTSKGEAVKEEVYSCVLDLISPEILKRAIETKTVFRKTNASTMRRVLRQYKWVTSSEETFRVTYARVDSAGTITPIEERTGNEAAAAENAAERSSTALVIAALLLFAAALLFAVSRFRADTRTIISYFRSAGLLYRILDIFAPLLLLTVLMEAALFLMGNASAAAILLLLPHAVICSVWAALFVRPFRHEPVYLFTAIAVIAIAVLFTPMFDSSMLFLRSVSWIRYALPTVWYRVMIPA